MYNSDLVSKLFRKSRALPLSWRHPCIAIQETQQCRRIFQMERDVTVGSNLWEFRVESNVTVCYGVKELAIKQNTCHWKDGSQR
jgi:hypothetical protein